MDTCTNQSLGASVKMNGGPYTNTTAAYDAAYGKHVVAPPSISNAPKTIGTKVPFSLKG